MRTKFVGIRGEERKKTALAGADHTATEEYRMLQECVSETMQQISSAGAPTGTSTKQAEMITHLINKISQDTIELMERNYEQLSAILKEMTKHYVAALNEIKQMSKQPST